MALFAALRNRPFACLWAGQAISQLGDSLYAVALGWYVLEQTGSAAASGTLLLLTFLPRILFLPVGGLAADRLPRIAILVSADIVRGGLLAVLTLLAVIQQLELGWLYAAGLLLGLASAFFEPTYNAALPDVVSPETLPSANALNSLTSLLIGVSGPAMGALIVSQQGAPAAFALNALSFFISAFLLRRLSSTPPHARPHVSPGVLGGLREGLRFVLASRWLMLSLVILALVNLTGRSPMAVALPFLVSRHLAGDVRALGLLQSALSLGAMAAAVGLGRARRMRRRGAVMQLSLVVVGAMTLALGLPLTLPGAVVVMLVMGSALSLLNLVWALLLQEKVPPGLRGRVLSLGLLGSNGLLPLGFGLVGWATDLLGPATVFVIAGALTAALAFAGLALRELRELD